MNEYPEAVLNLYAKCPLMTLAPSSNRSYRVACGVVRWALLREFEGERKTLAQVREYFCVVWKSLYYPEYRNTEVPPSHPTYWEGPRKSRPIGKKIYDFVCKYEVLHPIRPYELCIADSRIRGEYALVRRRTEGGISSVLITPSHPPLHKAYPDMVSLARWLDARRQSTSAQDPRVLHFPLTRGDLWRYEVDERLAERWLESILKVIPTTRYAAPGSHCQDCVRHDCLEAIRG